MFKEQLEKAWSQMPWEGLPLSFQVDLCQFLSFEKPTIRSKIMDFRFLDSLIKVSESAKWEIHYEDQGYFVISRCKNLCREVLALDQSPDPHEEKLGYLLGYPECCSKFIAQNGEDMIDNLDLQFNNLPKNGDFQLIDISHYKEGISLLSHVPCSVECSLSLELAMRIKKFILDHANVREFSGWAEKIKSHYCFNALS